jgi:hypothetical protein
MSDIRPSPRLSTPGHTTPPGGGGGAGARSHPAGGSVLGDFDRVLGPTTEIKFVQERDRRLPRRRHLSLQRLLAFLEPENAGTFFASSTPAGEVFPNRYQILDQIVCTADSSDKTA